MRRRLTSGAPHYAAVWAAIAVGGFAALTVPFQQHGLSLTLTAIGAAIVVAFAGRRAMDASSAVFAAVALALATAPTVRAATWLVALDMVGALVLASHVMASGRSWAAVARSVFAVAPALRTAPEWISQPLLALIRRRDPARARTMLRGSAAALGLCFGFGALFASADAAFAHVAGELLNDDVIGGATVVRVLVFLAVTLIIGALIGVAARPPVAHEPGEPSRRLARAEWAIPLGALVALFAGFVAIQLSVLFGGRTRVLETTGLTYAEYAREGFAQLVVCAGLVLAIVALASRYAEVIGTGDRVLKRGLLAALCLLTLIVLASAFRRLELYEEAYGFTRARVLGHALTIWIGLVLVLVLVAGALGRSGWLPRAVLMSAVLGLVGITVLNPDAYIARRNIERYAVTGRIDLDYLSGLSADAVPALSALDGPLGACVLRPHRYRLREREPWYAYNLARARPPGLRRRRLSRLCTATTVTVTGTVDGGSSCAHTCVTGGSPS